MDYSEERKRKSSFGKKTLTNIGQVASATRDGVKRGGKKLTKISFMVPKALVKKPNKDISLTTVSSYNRLNSARDDSVIKFSAEAFSAEEYARSFFATKGEKDIIAKRDTLRELSSDCADELRKDVHANSFAFSRISREVGELEGSLQEVRAGLNQLQTNLQQRPPAVFNPHLEKGEQRHSRSSADDSEGRRGEDSDLAGTSALESKAAQWEDTIEEMLALRLMGDAREQLQRGEGLLAELLSEAGSERLQHSASRLAASLCTQRSRLLQALRQVAASEHALEGSAEQRRALELLLDLGEPALAQHLLLSTIARHLHTRLHSLRPRGGVAADGAAYCLLLCSAVFPTVVSAVEQCERLFHTEPAQGSGLVVWALHQVHLCSGLLSAHALPTHLTPHALRTASDCSCIARTYCNALEARGLTVGPSILPPLEDYLVEALEYCAQQARDAVLFLAAADAGISPPERSDASAEALSGASTSTHQLWTRGASSSTEPTTSTSGAAPAAVRGLPRSAQEVYWRCRGILHGVHNVWTSDDVAEPAMEHVCSIYDSYTHFIKQQGRLKRAGIEALVTAAESLANDLLPPLVPRVKTPLHPDIAVQSNGSRGEDGAHDRDEGSGENNADGEGNEPLSSELLKQQLLEIFKVLQDIRECA